jgi:hypothetical protein
MVAIIQSGDVFIDSPPNRALRMICFRKSRRSGLVETCLDCPESCGRSACRQAGIRQQAILSMIGPNRAAAFNRR